MKGCCEVLLELRRWLEARDLFGLEMRGRVGGANDENALAEAKAMGGEEVMTSAEQRRPGSAQRRENGGKCAPMKVRSQSGPRASYLEIC